MKWIFLLCITVIISGCSFTVPQAPLSYTDYSGLAEPYEILGPVMGTSSTAFFLGIPMKPDGGYNVAYRYALLSKPGANALINTYSDVTYSYFFYIYIERKTTVYGTAIQTGDPLLALNSSASTLSHKKQSTTSQSGYSYNDTSNRSSEQTNQNESKQISKEKTIEYFENYLFCVTGYGSLKLKILYDSYSAFCKSEELTPLSKNMFHKELKRYIGDAYSEKIVWGSIYINDIKFK
ncbi:MAG: primase-like DNA-binding domain-containing protein [Candidatus Electryonea clarkiae]|nr:primase-like DNA-binding domain-containing protein [Candidatus Electryonea clarkiae]MDP8285585.1 primase-like DNA-binding domain-containing protein [Candidatus Electryonea clarkiae]